MGTGWAGRWSQTLGEGTPAGRAQMRSLEAWSDLVLSLLATGLWLICHLETAAGPAYSCRLLYPTLDAEGEAGSMTSSPHTTESAHPSSSHYQGPSRERFELWVSYPLGLGGSQASFCCSSYSWCPGSQKRNPSFFRSLGEDQPACSQGGGFEPVREDALLPFR